MGSSAGTQSVRSASQVLGSAEWLTELANHCKFSVGRGVNTYDL